MTQMPELVALMHSLVGPGLPGGLCQLHRYLDPGCTGAAKTIHEVEIYVGILIGAVTFSGSLIAFGKLSTARSAASPAAAGRHWLNLLGLLVVIWFGKASSWPPTASQRSMLPLVVMTVIALLFGIHMVMAIGGADMPVVVSMLNSYSGWAAAATGFMLSNTTC